MPASAPSFPEDHPMTPLGKTGVLLVNLGTPDAPTARAVRRYLAQFLSDRRVVDYPRAFWLPLLHGVILNVRPAITARNYAKIWLEEHNESPLRYYTRAQAAGLSQALRSRHESPPLVDWAMRYGTPSLEQKITELQQAGCDRLLVVPLYPQYSATTTATVTDEVMRVLKGKTWQPALRIAPPFHDDPFYIAALRDVTARHLGKLTHAPERIILSFHGIPERYFRQGDPYHCHCQKTARLLREAMGWSETFAPLAFQSKFGREKWLEPSTEQTINKAAAEGIKNLAVITPAFISDCIETLEEVAIGLAESFVKQGGENLSLVPCLNDSPELMDLLVHLTEQESAGWLDPA